MKKQKRRDLFTDLVLDEEEKLLEEALEKGQFEEEPNFVDTKVMLQEAAARHGELHNSKPVTIRIKQLDLIKVKAKAKAKNILYQTLIGSLIHQYAEGEEKLSL